MKFKYFFIFFILFSFNAKSLECFVVQDLNKNEIIKNSNKEVCETRFSPCSSFKVPLSLMGFDSGVLKNEKEPEMEYKEWYSEGISELQLQSHNPEKWMRNSTVWYSQEAVAKKNWDGEIYRIY